MKTRPNRSGLSAFLLLGAGVALTACGPLPQDGESVAGSQLALDSAAVQQPLPGWLAYKCEALLMYGRPGFARGSKLPETRTTFTFKTPISFMASKDAALPADVNNELEIDLRPRFDLKPLAGTPLAGRRFDAELHVDMLPTDRVAVAAFSLLLSYGDEPLRPRALAQQDVRMPAPQVDSSVYLGLAPKNSPRRGVAALGTSCVLGSVNSVTKAAKPTMPTMPPKP
jgi:hypothetical protein